MRIAVIGGGLGGLTAARALVAAGHDAHVLEGGARAGGVIGTSANNVAERIACSIVQAVLRHRLFLLSVEALFPR